MQSAQESKWTTDLRGSTSQWSQEAGPKVRATRMKVARKKKLKDPLPDFEEQPVPIHVVVEDVLKYMKKKEKVVAKINGRKTTKLSEKAEMDEVKTRIMQIESNMSAKFSLVEQNMNILKNLFDDMKRSNEERHAKWDADLNSLVVKTEARSDKEKAKVVAALQKLHKEHGEEKKSSAEGLKRVEQHAKRAAQSLVVAVQSLSDDLSHTKDDVDILMKKRAGIAIGGGGGGGQGLNTSTSGFCSVDEGVDLLASRMSKLDSRIADIEQHDLAARGASSRGQRRGQQVGADSVELFFSVQELEERMAKNETVLERLVRKSHERGRSSSRGRHGDSDDEAPHRRDRDRDRGGDEQQQEQEQEQQLQQQVKALQKKLKALGDSTSRACRSLSVGVTDAQNASLQLYSWADKVHAAFGLVSRDCLKLTKNVCPRAKLAELSSVATRGSAGEGNRGRGRGRGGKDGGPQGRSLSAGAEQASRGRGSSDSD